MKHNTDGGKTTYYDVFDGCTDVDSVMMKLHMTGAEFTILKSLIGIVISRHSGHTRHSGTDAERDCNKIIHYAELIKESLNQTKEDSR